MGKFFLKFFIVIITLAVLIVIYLSYFCLETDRFDNLIKDPTASQDVLINIINKISENSKLEVLFKNFVSFLITRRRLFYVEQILRSFIEIC